MRLLEITNVDLARNSDIGSSYVSRLRQGERKLPKEPEFLESVSRHILKVARKKGRLELLSQMVGMTDIGEMEEQISYLTNWFCSKVTVSDVISTLMTQIPEEDIKDLVQKHRRQTFSEPVCQYYYGIEGSKQANIQLFKDILKSDKLTKIMWFIDEPMDWTPYEETSLDEYTDYLKAIISQGHQIKIIYRVDRFIGVFSQFNFWLPIFMAGNIFAYKYSGSKDQCFSRTLCIAEGVGAISRHSIVKNKNDRVTTYTKEKRAMDSMAIDFEYLLTQSEPIAIVNKDNNIENYKKFIENLNLNKGDIYYRGQKPGFYTMPEELAVKIDRENPDLDFLPTYFYGREKFFKLVENVNTVEDISLLQEEGDYKILFGGDFIPYSKGDYILHLEEILRLLKKYDKYQLNFSNKGPLKVSILVTENDGMIIDKLYNPRVLSLVQDSDLVKEFINYVKTIQDNSAISKKSQVISYIEKVLNSVK